VDAELAADDCRSARSHYCAEYAISVCYQIEPWSLVTCGRKWSCISVGCRVDFCSEWQKLRPQHSNSSESHKRVEGWFRTGDWYRYSIKVKSTEKQGLKQWSGIQSIVLLHESSIASGTAEMSAGSQHRPLESRNPWYWVQRAVVDGVSLLKVVISFKSRVNLKKRAGYLTSNG
jgi:hypothetical protein